MCSTGPFPETLSQGIKQYFFKSMKFGLLKTMVSAATQNLLHCYETVHSWQGGGEGEALIFAKNRRFY